MKKQIIATAVAVAFAFPAMADITLTGSGSYKYVHEKNKKDKTSKNKGVVEGNINLTGHAGETKFVAVIDLDSDGTEGGKVDTSTGVVEEVKKASTVEVEDLYLQTSLGPVNVKAGNFGGSGSDLLGEIDNGAREHGRVHLSMDPMEGVTIYGGNGAKNGVYNNNAYFGVAATIVEGWKFEAAKNNEDKNSFGVNGTFGPVGIRAEVADSDVKAENGHFYHLTGKFDNISVGFAMIDMDANGSKTAGIGITEDDSGLFAESNDSRGNSNAQFDVSLNMDGTTFGLKVGEIGYEGNTEKDIEYRKISVGRDLSSGINLGASYKTLEQANAQDKETFEVKMSLSF